MILTEIQNIGNSNVETQVLDVLGTGCLECPVGDKHTNEFSF